MGDIPKGSSFGNVNTTTTSNASLSSHVRNNSTATNNVRADEFNNVSLASRPVPARRHASTNRSIIHALERRSRTGQWKTLEKAYRGAQVRSDRFLLRSTERPERLKELLSRYRDNFMENRKYFFSQKSKYVTLINDKLKDYILDYFNWYEDDSGDTDIPSFKGGLGIFDEIGNLLGATDEIMEYFDLAVALESADYILRSKDARDLYDFEDEIDPDVIDLDPIITEVMSRMVMFMGEKAKMSSSFCIAIHACLQNYCDTGDPERARVVLQLFTQNSDKPKLTDEQKEALESEIANAAREEGVFVLENDELSKQSVRAVLGLTMDIMEWAYRCGRKQTGQDVLTVVGALFRNDPA